MRLSGNNVVATDADILTIHTLLGSHRLDLVLVRYTNNAKVAYPLTDIAEGPFTTDFAYGYHTLHGFDKKTGERTSLRITEGNLVELSTAERSDWYLASMGNIQLWIPEEMSAASLGTQTSSAAIAQS